jgi:MFS family permease
MSVAAVMTTTTTLAADYFSGPERERFFGFQGASIAFSGVLFLVGGGIAADLHWRGPFAIYFLALVLLPVVWIIITEPSIERKPKGERKLTSPAKVPWALVALLYFIAWFIMAIFFLVPVKLPFYLKELSNASGTVTGLSMGMLNLSAAVTSLLYGRLKKHGGFRSIYLLAFCLIGFGYVLVANAGTLAMVLPGLAFVGLGFGMFMPNTIVWLTTVTPLAMRGRIIGGYSTCLFMGQFLSPIVFQPVVATNGIGGMTGVYGVAGILSGLFAVGFALSFLFRKNGLKGKENGD